MPVYKKSVIRSKTNLLVEENNLIMSSLTKMLGVPIFTTDLYNPRTEINRQNTLLKVYILSLAAT